MSDDPQSWTDQPLARAGPGAAAFFDLDRTLISRATPLALAGTFRRRRLLRRRDLVRAATWHLIFLIRGLGTDAVRRAAEDGMVLLRGVRVADMEEALGEAMERVLRPLIYSEPLELMRRHREQGERVYVVSASLQQIVEHIARALGFDGAVGSTCEIVDGVYTGRALQPCYGELKAQAVRELAARDGIALAASSAYSDSCTDLAFLEVVGNPTAVNPDARLRAIALEKGWPILRFAAHEAPTVAVPGRLSWPRRRRQGAAQAAQGRELRRAAAPRRG